MTYKSTNFFPTENKTITWAAASNSQEVQFTTTISGPGGIAVPGSLEIMNATSVGVFVRWSTATGSATSADYYVGPGVDKIIEVGAPNVFVQVIPVGSVTGSVYLSRGRGA